MSHIFISYSKKDRDYARKLADHLLSLGFDIWIDDQIDYGDDWWRTIVRAIRGAKAFIVIMTNDSDASEWVQREVTLADKSKIPAFPVWLSGDVDVSENWAIYVRTQYADVRHGGLPKEDFYNRLGKVASHKSASGKDVTPGQPQNIAWDIDALTKATLAILPEPFGWCQIPVGKVKIEFSETNRETVDVPEFLIAQYPITNAQYQVFVDAKDGYTDGKWWDYSEDAKKWRKENNTPNITFFAGDNLPRTSVNWYESLAFSYWLSAQLNLKKMQILLPMEREWQRAAQGNHEQLYPWGNDFDQRRCNTRESNINSPTPVMQYTSGKSPFGVFDMIGNVWEWCLAISIGDTIDLLGANHRVIRGGSWHDNHHISRVAFRNSSVVPDFRGSVIGFRIVCHP